ncbi:hypothetical protein HDF24_01170 [Mucilaginibacter sp. X4EP1]|uniref:hypothetical protein n=1 Tax=Mucilaginibacter sp. X4EP1 TaxID=2723092 RepID=UPI002169941F|nr:hypothetical protein [Mucilaginibacter sp. X4EP1]MCS3811626.1 hypothetical protein [Mucilaginibacter sp. X4EP1]
MSQASVFTFSNENSTDKSFYVGVNPTPAAGWCACLLAQPLKDQPVIGLDTTWAIANNAVYIYAPKAPSDETAFLKLLNNFLNPLSSYTNLFLWINNAETLSGANNQYVAVQQNLVGLRLTNNNANILFGGLVNLSIGINCLVNLDDSNLFFNIVQQNTSGPISFSNNQSTSSSQIVNSTLYISMTGDSLGCFRFGINFIGIGDWNAYNTGLKYFYNDNNGKLNQLNYPLLDNSYTSVILFQASLDPINQLNNAYLRTYLAFNTGNTIFPTYLRSDVGNMISLIANCNFAANPDALPFSLPADNASLLVFSSSDKAGTLPSYLLMQGGFFASTPNTKPVNLLCGLSGVETISVNPRNDNYPGDFLLFITGQPAYAPLFPFPDNQTFTNNPLLTDDYLSAWVSVVSSTGPSNIAQNTVPIRYYSQPAGASLYAVTDITDKTTTPFLGFYEPVTAALEVSNAPVYFPLAFYGSFIKAATAGGDIALFENKILSPWRKITIENAVLPQKVTMRKLKPPVPTVDPTPSTTPQGLMVLVDEQQNTWQELILAKNYAGTSPNPGPSDLLTLDFVDLNPRLQSAFQTNQQFLVIGLDKPLPDDPSQNILGTFNNTMELEGWPFILNVPQQNTYGQFNNVLIFKFCKGTLYDRVQNPVLWTNPEDFNETSQDGLNTISDWLTAYIKDGIDKGKGANPTDPDFANFASIVTDPDWNGILALKTDIGLKNFPAELQGLLAGIDLSMFNAHHFGINANQIKTATVNGKTVVSMDDKSSMFGLIYYVDPAFAPYTNDIDSYKQTLTFNPASAYDFKTLMLKVLFENSKIKSFKSFIQLSVYKLFDSPVKQTPGRDNILILTGSYEDHNGSPAYTFNGYDDDLIPLNNSSLGIVEIIRSNFSTLTPTMLEQSENLVFAQFALWGYLNFTKPTGMDVLSFGSADPANPGTANGLSYSQLLIKMNFSLDTPAIKTFEFDISEISFDIPTSTPRSASLYNHFPITLTSLVGGDAKNLPANLGFIPISTPNVVNTSVPTDKWYGLIYDFNLGTPGALAASAGFKSSMMFAWSVVGGSVFTGLKLPGMSSQSKMLSLQGVLSIDIASIKLLMAKTDESEKDATAFLLMLNNITLKFLSKKFPSGASIDFYLFGDPAATAQPTSMAWYTAYQKDSKSSKKNNLSLNP